MLLENGSRQEIDPQTGRLNILTFAENSIELTEGAKAAEQRFRDSSEMSIAELLHPNPAVVNARDFPKLRAEAHKRLSSPLTALSFALVALVSVLGGSFRRHGGLLRIVTAVLVIVGLLAAELAFSNLAARSPRLLPLVWLQATLPGVVAAAMLFWPRGLAYRRNRRRALRLAEAFAGR